MQIYGIAATESVDRAGERVMLAGMDISEIRLLNDEHQSKQMFQILGSISEAKKIQTLEECTDDQQLSCWMKVKKPFLYIRGDLASEEGHPNAQAAAALIKFGLQNPGFKVGLSVEGSTIERKGNDLTRTKVLNVSLTVKPANPDTFIFPVQNLEKSWGKIELPEQYKNVEGRKQFKNIPSPQNVLLAKSEFIRDAKNLMKSGPEKLDGATIIKCWSCGQGKIFMKSRLPNHCVACSEPFSMLDIYKARCSKPII